MAPVERILKRTNMRVSDEAVEEFAHFLEELVFDIASEAASIAKNKGRKTITLDDVIEAKRKIK